MALPLLKLLPAVLKTIAKITGIDVVDKAAEAISGTALTAEKEAELQQAMLQHEAAMEQLSIEKLKVLMSESIAMVASEDKYVRRARPTGLYLFYGVSTALAIVQGFLTIYAAVNGVAPVKLDAAAILVLVGPLAGVGGTYVYNRTKEKINGGGAE